MEPSRADDLRDLLLSMLREIRESAVTIPMRSSCEAVMLLAMVIEHRAKEASLLIKNAWTQALAER